MADPITAVRSQTIAPQTQVVGNEAPTGLDGTPLPFELPPAPSARTAESPQGPGVLAFGPQFRYTRLSEAEAVTATNQALTAARNDVASKGFVATPHDFVPSLAFRDELGRSNVRMDRTYQGIPIFGAQAIAHLDADGRVASMTGAPIPAVLPIDTTPTITADAAKATAINALGATPTASGTPTLVVVQTDDGEYHLAYHVTATIDAPDRAPRRTNSFVDATTGVLLPLSFDEPGGFLDQHQVNEARTLLGSRTTTGFALRPQQAAAAVPAGFGQSLYSGMVPLATSRNGRSGYALRDPATGSETRDANNVQSLFGALGRGNLGGIFGGGIFGGGSQPRVITDSNNQWGEPGDSPRARAGIDAHYAAVSYLGYLRDVFGRNSIDGRGMRLTSNVHVKRDLVNAYWDGSTMNYGDGDGRVAGPMVDPDIAGHEMTHGLTQFTSRLVYRGESGALNEAGSDILGSAGLAWYLRGRRDQGVASDYAIGESAFTPSVSGDALRYMDAPARDRRGSTSEFYSRDNVATMYRGDQDNGGVHFNSGVANNFFYLLANGGENPTSRQRVAQGVGIEKALRIYYRAHTVYYTPNETFAQARLAWERAATDLYGANSPELATVRAAASAVGIAASPAVTGLVS